MGYVHALGYKLHRPHLLIGCASSETISRLCLGTISLRQYTATYPTRSCGLPYSYCLYMYMYMHTCIYMHVHVPSPESCNGMSTLSAVGAPRAVGHQGSHLSLTGMLVQVHDCVPVITPSDPSADPTQYSSSPNGTGLHMSMSDTNLHVPDGKAPPRTNCILPCSIHLVSRRHHAC